MYERVIRFDTDPEAVLDNPDPPPISGDTREEQVVSALRTVRDPEIPVNIYDLGLVYRIELADPKHVQIQMTLTAPACPVAGSMPGAVQRAVMRVPGIEAVEVELVWDPPWTQDRMSDEARLELGLL
ncbi:MAG: SUF system Fe-S cluster assembly protein [Thiogranum sp.]